MDTDSAIVIDESLEDSESSGNNDTTKKENSSLNTTEKNTHNSSKSKRETKSAMKTKVKLSKISVSNTSRTKTKLNNAETQKMKKCCVKIKKEDLKKLKALFSRKRKSKTLKKSLEVETQKEKSQNLTNKQQRGRKSGNKEQDESPTNKRTQSKSPIFIRFPISNKNKFHKEIMKNEKYPNKSPNQKGGNRRNTKLGRSFLKRKFGAKFFSCHVQIKRVTHPDLESYRKDRKNNRKTVSFVETVEVFNYYSPNGKVGTVSQSSSSEDEEHKIENDKKLEMGNTSTPLKRVSKRTFSQSERNDNEEENNKKSKRLRHANKTSFDDESQTYKINLISDDEDSSDEIVKATKSKEQNNENANRKFENGDKTSPEAEKNLVTSDAKKEDNSMKNKGKTVRKSIDENNLKKGLELLDEKRGNKQDKNEEISGKRKPVERIIEIEILDDGISAQNEQKSPPKVDNRAQEQAIASPNTSNEKKNQINLSSDRSMPLEKAKEMNGSHDNKNLTPIKTTEEQAQNSSSSFEKGSSVSLSTKRSTRRLLSQSSNASTSTNGSKRNDLAKSAKALTYEDDESEKDGSEQEDNDKDLSRVVSNQSPIGIHGRKSYRADKSPITVAASSEEEKQTENLANESLQSTPKVQNKIFDESMTPEESSKKNEIDSQHPIKNYEVQQEMIELNNCEKSKEKKNADNDDDSEKNLSGKYDQDKEEEEEDIHTRLLRKLREDIINEDEDVILTDDEDDNQQENNDKNKSDVLPGATTTTTTTTTTPFDDDSDDSLLLSLNKISGGVENSIKSASETIDLFEVVKRSAVPKETRLTGNTTNRSSTLNQLLKSNESLEYDDNVLKNDPNMSTAAVPLNDKNDDFSDADEYMAGEQDGRAINDDDDDDDVVVESLQFSGTNDNDDIINQVEVDLDQSLNENNKSNNKNDKNEGTKFTLNKLLKIFN